jgi:mRNA interferase HicA
LYIFLAFMNSNQFKAWFRQQGCTFEAKPGSSGHLIVRLGDRKTNLPMHGVGDNPVDLPCRIDGG